MRIGLLAGFIGVTIGATLAFIAGYYGGCVDNVIRVMVDIGLTIPGLLILIIIAHERARRPDRQPDGLRRRGAGLALSGAHHPLPGADPEAARLRPDRPALRDEQGRRSSSRSCCPTCCPTSAASLVGSVSAGVLASIGLEVLGLGPFEAPTLGMTIYWVNYNAAIINGWWWWWVPPIVVIAILFTGLFLVAVGLDEIANPRVRSRA